ncbi:MAG: histidine kinase [Deltaproteobacteria bacterium]|nr:histidine kinase [Deltaproteobacteria bacterium]
MEALFKDKSTLGFFIAWIPLTALVGVLLHVKELSWMQSTILAICFGVPMAIASASSQYMCRVLPLRRSRLTQVIPALVGACIVVSGGWTAAFYSVCRTAQCIPAHKLDDVTLLLFMMGDAYFAFSLVLHYLLIAVAQTRDAEKRAHEARVLGREAELRALRAQVNPHFLFNSLNSVAALVSISSERAREMVLLLSDFFRSTLAFGKQETVTLGEELMLVDKYLQIEAVRFGDRMEIDSEVDVRCNTLELPPLLLQPLFENAVKHGVSSSVDTVTIRTRVKRVDNTVQIVISNEYDEDAAPRRGTHTGLSTTRERVKRFFGESAKITATRQSGVFKVDLALPAKDEEKQK